MPSTSNKSKLIFHIGHHDTDATAIQNALATGRILVEGKRILYTADLDHNYLHRHFDAFAASGTVCKGNLAMPSLPKVAERLRDGGFEFAVFSAEEFEDADPSSVAQVLEKFMLPYVNDYMVLCYVRPHAARILSGYCDRVKIGSFDGTLDAFHLNMLLSERLCYADRLAPWVKTFGDRFVVRPMLHHTAIIDDFAKAAFGSEAAVTVIDRDLSNETLNVEDIVMLRYVMSHLKRHGQVELLNIVWMLSAALNSERPPTRSTKPMLHRALAEDIRCRYLDDARAMDERFFSREPVMELELDRSVRAAIATSQSFEPSDYFSPNELRNLSALATGICAMLDH